MRRDFITAEEHSRRRQELERQVVDATSAFDEILCADDDGKATREARWTVEHLQLRIDALDRARVLSAEEEVQQAERDRLERIKQQAADIHELAEMAQATARKAEESFQIFLADMREANSRWLGFAGAMGGLAYERLGSGHPRLQAITMALNHRFEGVVAVGRLQAANVPGLDLVDDPMDAMRQHAGKTLSGLVGQRIHTVLRQATIDIPELKETKPEPAELVVADERE